MRKLFLFIILLSSFHAFSQDRDWDLHVKRGAGETIRHGLITSGEILIMNGTFTFINWATGWDWAVPSLDSVRFNLSNAWIWEDDDGFFVNQFGHPFQGSLYFSAARANGFGFYQTLFFNVFGSASWEVFFENKHASINDFFTTVPGAFSAGEISYRLYIEAIASGVPAPLAFFLSPAAGLNRLLTGWEPPNTGRNLHELRYFLGAAYAQTHSSIDSDNEERFSFNGFHGDLGFKFVYGNPFIQETRVPYRHFEFAMSYGIQPISFHDIRMLSDGYLFSFNPVYTNRHNMSTGLSLNMDFTARGRFHIHDSTINQYSNALNWTFKSQHLFSRNTVFQAKGHAGFTFFGASKYYSPDFGGDLNNYGYGLNSKFFFNLENRALGRFELDLLGYVLWPYPGTSDLSNGTVYWFFSDLSYSRFVTERISLGITGSIAREWGRFGSGGALNGFPDTRKRNDTLKLFVAWNI